MNNNIAFVNRLSEQFPTGLIVAGGGQCLWMSAMEAITNGRPLFVLKGTGGTADILANLIEIYDRRRLPSEDPMYIGDEEKAMELLEERFPKKGARFAENAEETWLQIQARVCGLDFPEQFVRDATLVFELGVHSVDDLQDEITRVMASVYNTNKEIGGMGAEIRSVLHARRLRNVLEKSSLSYRSFASMLQAFTRILVILAVSLTIVQSYLDYEKILSATNLNILKSTNIIIPLCIGIVTSLYATYQPMPKFAALFAAAKRIESEEWRFRMRVGIYQANMNVASTFRTGRKTHRERFADQVAQLFSEVAKSDVVNGFIFTGAKSDSAQMLFTQDDGEDPRAQKKKKRVGPKAQSEAFKRVSAVGAHWASKKEPGDDPNEDEMVLVDGADLYHGSRGDSRIFPTSRFMTKNEAARARWTAKKKKENDLRKFQADKEETRVLTPKEYINQRVLPALKENQDEVRKDSTWLRNLQFLAVLVSTICSGLAAFDLHLWVPVALSFAALLEFIISYRQLESRIPSTNVTINTLTSLLCYWDGLSLIARRMPRNKELLVNTTEDALLLKHEAFVQQALKQETKSSDNADEINDGEEGDATNAKKKRKSGQAIKNTQKSGQSNNAGRNAKSGGK